MTVLLGATFALLLAAVVLSFQNMNQGVANASPEELKRLQGQIDELKIEQERMKIERELQKAPLSDEPSATEVEEMKADLAAKEAEIAALAEEKSEAEKKAQTYRDEAGFIGQRELEKHDDEQRRARLIYNALLIGRIKEYVADPDFGGFTTIDVVLPDQVKVGSVLAIRRNNGILGQVKITDVSPDGAIGNPLPGFGEGAPQVGDELIIPPQF
jgi:Skp family chaperone for outer membrane proteins